MPKQKIMTISRTDDGIEYDVHVKSDITWLIGMLEYIKVKIMADNQ